MAFPGTFNIDYYKGDTYEFRIYPKDSSGAPFSLFGYGAERFTIAPTRGEINLNNIVECYASIENDHILCVIRPSDGEKLDVANSPYYYDVEIENTTGDYVKLYTMITGSITVTEQVTPKKLVPNVPTDITISDITETSFTVNWLAPTSGQPFSGFTIGINSAPTITGATLITVDQDARSYTFADLDAGTYFVGVLTSNSAGVSDPAFFNGFISITGEES
jgi:hypothetical protein